MAPYFGGLMYWPLHSATAEIYKFTYISLFKGTVHRDLGGGGTKIIPTNQQIFIWGWAARFFFKIRQAKKRYLKKQFQGCTFKKVAIFPLKMAAGENYLVAVPIDKITPLAAIVIQEKFLVEIGIPYR